MTRRRIAFLRIAAICVARAWRAAIATRPCADNKTSEIAMTNVATAHLRDFERLKSFIAGHSPTAAFTAR